MALGAAGDRDTGHLFVILGGTGDLADGKLLPALSRLRERRAIPERCVVLGVSRNRELDDEAYRAWAREVLAEHGLAENLTSWCDDRLHFQSAGKERSDYEALKERIEEIERLHDLPPNRVFYLALPPVAFPGVVENLGAVGLNRSDGWTRLVVEKPFGTDLATARELNELVHRHFEEDQVYRIDHYLGKDTVQNLLVFRFANQIFESIWNRDRIEAVHITVAEEVSVDSRAAYYDRSGALRDMVQNHLAQLVSMTAMEVPGTLEADAIRNEKVKVLQAARPFSPDDVVFGRYERGLVGGSEVKGYLEEEGVPADSDTETYAALRLNIDNWRWQGVPFYLRTGKRLERRLTQIVVTFRCAPVSLFSTETECPIHSNVLTMTLQPDEGFSLDFEVKPPGEEIRLETEQLEFRYADAFEPLPDAYETLILDIATGDQTLFVRADEVEASWALFEPVLYLESPRFGYPAGSWGPKEADLLLEGLLHTWPEARPRDV